MRAGRAAAAARVGGGRKADEAAGSLARAGGSLRGEASASARRRLTVTLDVQGADLALAREWAAAQARPSPTHTPSSHSLAVQRATRLSLRACLRPTKEAPILLGLHCGGIASFSAAFEALGLPAKVVWATEVSSNPGAVHFLSTVEGADVVVVDEGSRYCDEVRTLVWVDIEIHGPPCNGFSGATRAEEAARAAKAEYAVRLWEDACEARWMTRALRPTLVVIENSPHVLDATGFSHNRGFKARVEAVLSRPVEAAVGDGVLGARYSLGVRGPGPEAPRDRMWGVAYLGGGGAAVRP